MKSMTTKLMMTAGALAIATGIASAQQYRADIPFAFRAGDRVLAAGTYVVRVKEEQSPLVTIIDARTRHSIVLLAASRSGSSKSPDGSPEPALTFVCGTGRCSLARFWTGPASPGLTFPQARLGKDERASATEIRMVKLNGD
jgi:hypothetical protein